MARKILWVLLALSISVNVAVGLGYWDAQRRYEQSREPRRAAAMLAERLGLTDDQRAEIRAIREGFRGLRRGHRRDFRAGAAEIWAALAEPEPDFAAIDLLIDAQAARTAALNRDMVRPVAQMLAVMTEEQRERFLELVARRPIMGGRFPVVGF